MQSLGLLQNWRLTTTNFPACMLVACFCALQRQIDTRFERLSQQLLAAVSKSQWEFSGPREGGVAWCVEAIPPVHPTSLL